MSAAPAQGELQREFRTSGTPIVMVSQEQLARFCSRYNYSGRLLHQDVDSALCRRLLQAIRQFHELEKLGAPFIPYIAAWRAETSHIWYEYASPRLQGLLGCQATEVAQAFRQSLVTRCLYWNRPNPPAVIKVVRNRHQLERLRDSIRKIAEQGGGVEAVYKIGVNGRPLWFKDLARVETHDQGRIILSFGSLIEVTKEMQLEEELKQAKEDLDFHRRNLEKLVAERTRRLEKAQLDVVTRLAKAAVCRDHKTGAHINRMSRYCALLGSAAGISAPANKLLYHAAPMHDVGKLGISDQILLKPGRLSDQEFEEMKSHCRLGAELLGGEGSKLLTVARTIALTHHERWDGSGYPQGLAGRDIPVAGRIAALCDVFDALTSARPYKRPWPFSSAAEEIRRLRDIHFDPQLVDLFVDNLPHFYRVYHTQ